jgi:hypothetical protein
MSDRSRIFKQNAGLASHILPVSGTMIGICVTLVGLVKVAETHVGPSHVDECAAIAAILFLASALTSYLSIRWSNKDKLSYRLEQAADIIFITSLIGITVISTLFAYEVI